MPGNPSTSPVEAVSRLPRDAVPEIVGLTMLTGACWIVQEYLVEETAPAASAACTVNV